MNDTSYLTDLLKIKSLGIKQIFYLHPEKRYITLILKNDHKITINGKIHVIKLLKEVKK